MSCRTSGSVRPKRDERQPRQRQRECRSGAKIINKFIRSAGVGSSLKRTFSVRQSAATHAGPRGAAPHRDCMCARSVRSNHVRYAYAVSTMNNNSTIFTTVIISSAFADKREFTARSWGLRKGFHHRAKAPSVPLVKSVLCRIESIPPVRRMARAVPGKLHACRLRRQSAAPPAARYYAAHCLANSQTRPPASCE